MPKIDKMLQMMKDRGVDRTVLRSNKPFQIQYGKAVTEGSVTPAAQLLEILEEITPPGFLPQLRNGGNFNFRHSSAFGNYDCGVESSGGSLQLSIATAKTQTPLTPRPPTSQSLTPRPLTPQPALQPMQPPSDVRREIYIHRNGQNIGPMSPEQASEGVRTGQYTTQDLAIAPHMKTWETVQKVLDFFGPTVTPNVPQTYVVPVAPVSITVPNSASSLLRSFLNEEQDPIAVEKVIDRLQQICTPEETILYIAVQKKLVVTFAPISVALTTKRVIVFRPKAMGLGLSFEDYPWWSVGNIHISEELLGSTFFVQLTNNTRTSVDSLPKAQARKLYQFGQQMEERMHLHRRDLLLEEKRAGAGNVNVNVNNDLSPAPAPPSSPAPFHSPMLAATPHSAAVDPVEILQKLKVLLDQGLISQTDYDSKKAEVMSRL